MPPVNDPASTTAGAASTFAKGLQVLRCFEGRREALSMAEVARLAGLDRATARRLCLALIDAGFLVARGRGLHLTARVLAVGAGYLAAHDVGRVVQPALNRAAEELGGDIALAVRDGGRAIYVACSATAGARVSQGFTAGSTLPLLPTAVGRMLLAGDTDTALDALLATPEATLRHTEATQMIIEP